MRREWYSGLGGETGLPELMILLERISDRGGGWKRWRSKSKYTRCVTRGPSMLRPPLPSSVDERGRRSRQVK
jgi:hypothetical protein